MFTTVASSLAKQQKGTPEQTLAALIPALGQCNRPLEHRSHVTLSYEQPAVDTEPENQQAVLTLNAYVEGGGDQRWEEDGVGDGLALRVNGNTVFHGTTEGYGVVPVGGIIQYYGTSVALTAILAQGYWVLCDGTQGTPNLGGKVIVNYAAGDPTYGTLGGTGGGSSGTSGSATTGISIPSGGSGTSGSATTGVTISSSGSGTSGASSTGITVNVSSAGVTDTNSANISSTPTIVQSGTGTTVAGPITDGPHSHNITGTHGHTINDPTHSHSTPNHTHTVSDSGHTHSTPAHTHSVTDGGHTHSVPVVLPSYVVLASLMRIR